VTAAAYLLFYRRRSDSSLGGPQMQQIVRDYDSQRERSGDESSESGEGQGLVANSSLRGSPSALTGVGAARRQPNLGSMDGEATMTINPSDLEKLPAYEAHEEEDGASPVLLRNATINDGHGLQNSIEDEGIDMDPNYNGPMLPQQSWTFGSLGEINANSRGSHMVSGTASDVASDDVQHNSSASEGSLRGRIEDFDNSIAEEEDNRPFIDQSPVPDLDEFGQANAIALQADLYETLQRGEYPGQEFEVTDERFEVEEPAAVEIHVKDNDDMRLD
jgi:ubiquitin carboxyl-terminal hydrolase 4/11/15